MSSGWNMSTICFVLYWSSWRYLLQVESISLGFKFDLVWRLEAYCWEFLQPILMKVALMFNSRPADNANQIIRDCR